LNAQGVLALAATLTSVGCNIAPPDPLALDPDAISIASVLVANETHARILVGYPHRSLSGPPPRISASLLAPGWRAAFTHETDPEDGCGGGPTFWRMPMVCLNASLPQPIREQVTYKLEGEGPKGRISGEITVPSAPLILDPGDTLWLPDSIRSIRIPIRYRAPPGAGTLRPEVLATHRTSTGIEANWVSAYPGGLDVDGQADTLSVPGADVSRLEAASMHLLGIGWNYTRFRESSRVRFPWPSFGLSGDGIYGYFDGSAKSRRVHIALEDGG